MNKVYRLVWNAALGLWQVAGEFAGGRRKQSGGRRTLAIATALFLLPFPASAVLPTGSFIEAGDGSVSHSGSELTITQTSPRLAIRWDTFSIGDGYGVRFVQPDADSVALNRILDVDVSTILGTLEANGQVFLVNPNGVLFGDNAQVDVGGLVVSTLDIATEDFMEGDYTFMGDSTNAIVNRGSIQAAEGGAVALIAARIENTGSIVADRGAVLMGAGRTVRLDLGGPVRLEVQEAALDALIEQGGAVSADGGLVYLTARGAGDLASTVINHSGITEARRLSTDEHGEVVLLGEQGTVQITGGDGSGGIHGGDLTVLGARIVVDGGATLSTGGDNPGAIRFGGGDGSFAPLADPLDDEAQYLAGLAASGAEAGISIGHATLDAGGGDIDLRGSRSGNDVAISIGSGAMVTTEGAGTIRVAGASGGDGVHLEGGGSLEGGDGGMEILSTGHVHIRSGGSRIAASGAGGIDIRARGQMLVNNGQVEVEDGDLVVETIGMIQPIQEGRIRSVGAGDLNLTSRANSVHLGGTFRGHIEATGSGDINLTVSGLGNTNGTLAGNAGLSIRSWDQGRHIVVGANEAGTLSVSSAWLSLIRGGGFDELTIGRTDGTGNIDIASAQFGQDAVVQTGGDISVRGAASVRNASGQSLSIDAGGSFSINGSILIDGGDFLAAGEVITLDGDASISNPTGLVSLHGSAEGGYIGAESGSLITARYLSLSGRGDVEMDTELHAPGVLAIDVDGSVVFRNRNALTIGSAGGLVGIDAGGPIDISTASGNLAIDGTIATTDGSAGAITLNAGADASAGYAAGGDIVLAEGAEIIAGDGGRSVLYTGSLSGSSAAAAWVGAGSGRFRYHSDEGASNFSAPLGAGAWLVYREQPILSVTSSDHSSVYGDTISLSDLGYALDGLINGDALATAGISGSANFATDASSGSNVGTYDIRYEDGLQSALGYAFEGEVAGQLTIERRKLSVDGSRVYDGTRELAATVFELDNLVAGESLLLSGYGEMTDKHVGDGKAVDVSGLTLADGTGQASNYLLVDGSVDITPAALTISTDDVVRTYDGTTAATGQAILAGGSLFDDDQISGGQFAFTDRNAGTDKTVTVSDVTIEDGNGGANYVVSYKDNETSTIEMAPLTVTAEDRFVTYNGAIYNAGFQAAYEGFANGDDESVLAGVLSFGGDSQTARNAGHYAITVSGLDAVNYAISYIAGTLTIHPSILVLSTSDVIKTYDGTTAADGTAVVTGGTLFKGDSLSGGRFAFTDKNAGTGKTVTVSDVAIEDGNGGANYVVSYKDNETSTIERRSVTVSGLSGIDRVYDGTTEAGVDAGAVTFSNKVAGDDLTIVATGHFADVHVGEHKTVTLTNRYEGDDAGNYLIVDQATTTASITPRPLTLVVDDQRKSFGTRDPALSWRIGEGRLLGDDRLTGALVREPGERIGTYRISGNPGHGDYAIRVVPGMLHIGPAPELETSVVNAVSTAPASRTGQPTTAASPEPASSGDAVSPELEFIAIDDPGGAAARASGPRMPVFVVAGGVRMPYDLRD